MPEVGSSCKNRHMLDSSYEKIDLCRFFHDVGVFMQHHSLIFNKHLPLFTGPVKMDQEVVVSETVTAPEGTKPKSQQTSSAKTVVHLWENSCRELFAGARLAASECDDLEPKAQTATSSSADGVQNLDDGASLEARLCEKKFCITCSAEFHEREEQTEHFKSDWHRFNLKKKLQGRATVTESAFEMITDQGDLSSISGSEASSDDEQVTASPEAGRRVSDVEEDYTEHHIEGIGKRHPRVFLRNPRGELMSLYRCVIHGKKNQASSEEEMLSLVQSLPTETKWCVLMMSAGHFAGALFDGEKVIEHKTFHRYVVRAKRGTLQSTRDSKGHAPKSLGASLRRYNESALASEVQELLTTWKDLLDACHRVFLRVASYNKSVFLGGKSPPFDKNDPRIRSIPFQTRRPTFREIKRVHETLTSVECYGTESTLTDHITSSPRKSAKTPPAAKTSKKPASADSTPADDTKQDASSDGEDLDVELVTEDLTIITQDLEPFGGTRPPKKRGKKKKASSETRANTDFYEKLDPGTAELRNNLFTACKTNDIDGLKALLWQLDEKCKLESVDLENVTNSKSDPTNGTEFYTNHCTVDRCSVGISPDAGSGGTVIIDKQYISDLVNGPFGASRSTLLHVSSQAGHKEILSLLMSAGADPTVKDGKGHVPYAVAASKDTRNEFRRFHGLHPEMYDYAKAQIPSPLSEEAELAKKAREAERRKVLKKAKKERLKDQKASEVKEREETREKERYLALSDREKRALAADRRLTAQHAAAGQAPRVLSRCFQCGTDITGKVPFEYHEYKFCLPKCLKLHRTQNTGSAKS